LRNHLAGFDAQALDRLNLARVISPAGLLEMQAFTRRLRVDEAIVGYIADIVSRDFVPTLTSRDYS
jgi:hypothetical protein